MYVQQLEHLKFKSFDELIDNVDSYIKEKELNYEYAGILHDKDLNENDEIKKPHIHLQFYCENKLSSKELKAMTKEDDMQQFDYMNNKVESFKYLIHATSHSRSKYQYSMYDVKSNFDYVDYIESTRSENSNL
ncbi:replication protein, partial [Staphylococcus hominis]|uniref:Rep family protein n=1 Tax=Staphylococcus hominis TaxID=1290 RepID=UPI001F58C3A5